MNKKAQIQVTFNWLYVLIAGGIILLFFIGIAVKQKTVAEESLQTDIVKTMESILVGAGVSEKTKNSVGTSGLSNYIMEFECSDGSSTFGIEKGTKIETKLKPIFSPKKIKTNRLILWSLPYKLPYKVMDLLIVSSVNTKYFVLGSTSTFGTELKKSVSKEAGEKVEFNFEFIDSLSKVKPGNNYHIRIVDLVSSNVNDKGSVPSSLANLDDSQVTAVVLPGGNGPVSYFQKNGNVWKQLGSSVPIISLGGEKDAAKYAALFAGDGENYKCNMEKVFKRMKYVNEVYEGKLGEMVNYYSDKTKPGASDCTLDLTGINGLKPAFEKFKYPVNSCVSGGYKFCTSLASLADKIKISNDALKTDNCIMLY